MSELVTPQSQESTKPTNYRLLDAYTATLEDHQVAPIKNELENALSAYPKLADETITVGRMPDEMDNTRDAYALADPYNRMIKLPTNEVPRNIVIFHELAHLLIYQQHWNGEDVPHTSEEYCSLVALDRMDPGLIYADRVPYFGEPDVSRDEWPKVAKAALDYRHDRGPNSHYVSHARELFSNGL